LARLASVHCRRGVSGQANPHGFAVGACESGRSGNDRQAKAFTMVKKTLSLPTLRNLIDRAANDPQRMRARKKGTILRARFGPPADESGARYRALRVGASGPGEASSAFSFWERPGTNSTWDPLASVTEKKGG
jgi:hypothetical protein